MHVHVYEYIYIVHVFIDRESNINLFDIINKISEPFIKYPKRTNRQYQRDR